MKNDDDYMEMIRKAQESTTKAVYEESAKNLFEAYTAYINAGFTENQAMFLLAQMMELAMGQRGEE